MRFMILNAVLLSQHLDNFFLCPHFGMNFDSRKGEYVELITHMFNSMTVVPLMTHK